LFPLDVAWRQLSRFLEASGWRLVGSTLLSRRAGDLKAGAATPLVNAWKLPMKGRATMPLLTTMSLSILVYVLKFVMQRSSSPDIIIVISEAARLPPRRMLALFLEATGDSLIMSLCMHSQSAASRTTAKYAIFIY